MDFSIIIPTYKRPEDLKKCLESILVQTVVPLEIIVVDNADSFETEQLICNNIGLFVEKGINLKYIKNGSLNSANIARNIGADESIGEILLFIDDDIFLNEDFIKEMMLVYEMYPNAIGVQGFIVNAKNSDFVNFIHQIFYLNHNKENHNKLLPSIQDVHAYPLTKIINCQWIMSGCTGYKKQFFKKFKFDENMYKYCSGDDVDISYRIYREYPNSLYQTPFAKVIHTTSNIGRAPKKELIYTTQVYHMYLFYKLIDQRLSNKLIFLWSRIGYALTKCGFFCLKPSRNSFIFVINLIASYFYCIIHTDSLKKGDLSFFTDVIIKKK